MTRRAWTDRHGKEADDSSCSPHVADNGDTVFESLATGSGQAQPRPGERLLPVGLEHPARCAGSHAAYGDLDLRGPALRGGQFRRLPRWPSASRRGRQPGHSDAYLLLPAQGPVDRLVTHQAGGGPLQRGCDGVERLSPTVASCSCPARTGRWPARPCRTRSIAAVPHRHQARGPPPADQPVDPRRVPKRPWPPPCPTTAGPSRSRAPSARPTIAARRRRRGVRVAPRPRPQQPDAGDRRQLDRLGPRSQRRRPASWSSPAPAAPCSDQDPEDGTLQPQIDLFGVRLP